LEYRKPKIAPSTYRYYDIAIRNRIVPYLGKIRAGKLKPEAIEKAVELLVASGKADGTIRSFYSTMSKAYNDGVRLGWVPYNPMLKVERRKLHLNPSKPIPRVDTDKLFSAANSNPTDLARLIAGVSLGLRPGTVTGLRWSDFDFNEEILWIRRQVQYIKGEGLVYCPPKTPMLEPIPLEKNEVKAFLDYKEIQELKKSLWASKLIKGKCPWKGDEEIVFPNAYGNLQNAKSDTRWFKKLCESAEIPVYQRYQMRKRAFTDLMMATNLANVMAYSGHTQSSTLLKHYISPELEDVRLAIKKRQELTQYSNERSEESHDRGI
jgi:integrase